MNRLTFLSGVVAAFAVARAIAGAEMTDEQTIRDLDAAWSAAANSKDAAKTASFYSETGSAMPFNGPIASGKAKVLEMWTGLMAKPGFSLTFKPTRIEIAQSRDIAYDVGTFELKVNDDKGAQMVIPGKYVVIWKKQKDGGWKVEYDIFNTDK